MAKNRGGSARRPAGRPRRRRGRADGILARRRRAQNTVIALIFVAVQIVAALAFTSVAASFAVLILTALALPVIVTLVLDRRP